MMCNAIKKNPEFNFNIEDNEDDIITYLRGCNIQPLIKTYKKPQNIMYSYSTESFTINA